MTILNQFEDDCFWDILKTILKAWKTCAKGIKDTNHYTHLTQFVNTELENSSKESKDSIRMEQLEIIESGEPPYFVKRAKELHV